MYERAFKSAGLILFAVVGYSFAALLFLIVATEDATTADRVGFLTCSALLVGLALRMARAGIYCRRSAVVVRSVLVTREIPWEDVEGVATVPGNLFSGNSIYLGIKRRNGTVVFSRGVASSRDSKAGSRLVEDLEAAIRDFTADARRRALASKLTPDQPTP